MKKRAMGLLVVVFLFAAGAYADDPLAAARFLIGKWEPTTAAAGQPSVATTFTSGLQNRIIVRNNSVHYPAAAGRPAYTHDDMLVIYAEGSAARADYFDSDGYVARYTMTSPAANYVVFTGDKVKGMPRYRFSYKLAPDGTVNGYAEMAQAATPDAFAPAMAWAARRK